MVNGPPLRFLEVYVPDDVPDSRVILRLLFAGHPKAKEVTAGMVRKAPRQPGTNLVRFGFGGRYHMDDPQETESCTPGPQKNAESSTDSLELSKMSTESGR